MWLILSRKEELPMDTVPETPAPVTTEAFAVWQLTEGMPGQSKT
jgi:hypothetical protein